MIRNVIEEAWLVQVGPHGEAVNLPGADAGLDLESVKTQADIRAFPHIDQTTRAIFHLLSAGSELDPVPVISRSIARSIPHSDFEECGLEIQFFFVDRSRAADPVRIQSTFQLHERAEVLAIVNVKIKHVTFVEIAVHERLLAPVVVSNLFPNLPSFAPHG